MVSSAYAYVTHRTRTHQPSANDNGLGPWQEMRRKYIREYCDESNIQTDAGREKCEKICGDHFCCFDTAMDGYSCQYDESVACEVDSVCQNILAGLLDIGNFDGMEPSGGALPKVTSLSEDNDSLVPPSAAGMDPPPHEFDQVPPSPIGDDSDGGDDSTGPIGVMDQNVIVGEYTLEDLREIKILLDDKKGSRKDNLVLMELEEEMGVNEGIVKEYLTRFYDHTDPTSTCFDVLYQSDENGDNILQKNEYINFIADFSDGDVDPDNYSDFPFAFKINFIYLSCQCKFLPMSEVNGGEECCLGPDAGIYISGTGSQEVSTAAEEVHLQLVCVTAQETIDYVRSVLPQTVAPTESSTSLELTDSPVTNPVSDVPTNQPTASPVVEIPSNQPTYHVQDQVVAEPTQRQAPSPAYPTATNGTLDYSATNPGDYTFEDLKEMKELLDDNNEKGIGSPEENLVLLELEEEMGIDEGVVERYLTQTYNPLDPKTTCYDILHRADEDGDGSLHRNEYTNFIAEFSEGCFAPDNYIDFPFAFKVNFIYLSCQCKFHPKSNANGGDDCCLGPDSVIYISGSGSEEVPTTEEEAHLRLVCLTAQGTIDYLKCPSVVPRIPIDSLPSKMASPVGSRGTFAPSFTPSPPSKQSEDTVIGDNAGEDAGGTPPTAISPGVVIGILVAVILALCACVCLIVMKRKRDNDDQELTENLMNDAEDPQAQRELNDMEAAGND